MKTQAYAERTDFGYPFAVCLLPVVGEERVRSERYETLADSEEFHFMFVVPAKYGFEILKIKDLLSRVRHHE